MRLVRVLVNCRDFDQTESTNSIKDGQTKWEKACFYERSSYYGSRKYLRIYHKKPLSAYRTYKTLCSFNITVTRYDCRD